MNVYELSLICDIAPIFPNVFVPAFPKQRGERIKHESTEKNFPESKIKIRFICFLEFLYNYRWKF